MILTWSIYYQAPGPAFSPTTISSNLQPKSIWPLRIKRLNYSAAMARGGNYVRAESQLVISNVLTSALSVSNGTFGTTTNNPTAFYLDNRNQNTLPEGGVIMNDVNQIMQFSFQIYTDGGVLANDQFTIYCSMEYDFLTPY